MLMRKLISSTISVQAMKCKDIKEEFFFFKLRLVDIGRVCQDGPNMRKLIGWPPLAPLANTLFILKVFPCALFPSLSSFWSGFKRVWIFFICCAFLVLFSRGAVAQLVERATPGEEVLGQIPAAAASSSLVGSVSVLCDRLRQKLWSSRSVSCAAARKIFKI